MALPIVLLKSALSASGIIGLILTLIIYLIIIFLFISGVKGLLKEYSRSSVWKLTTSLMMLSIILFIKTRNEDYDDDYDDYDY